MQLPLVDALIPTAINNGKKATTRGEIRRLCRQLQQTKAVNKQACLVQVSANERAVDEEQ